MTATEYEMPPEVVPPGDQTGIYYIPISSLPFHVSWQQIKDYVRQFCPVDHVEIFQKSTCGWVRVLGKENFETAYENLNGKEFQGRSIIADKRNATQPLVVRDLNTPVPAKRLPGKGSRAAAPMISESPTFAIGGPVCRPDSSIYPSPASTTSSSFSQGGDGYGIYSTPSSSSKSLNAPFSHVPAQGYDALPLVFPQSNNTMPFYGYGPCLNTVPAPQPFMNYPPSSCGPQVLCDPSTSFPVQPPYYNEFYHLAPAAMNYQMANLTLGESPPGGIVYTEQRAIHIRRISRRASEDEIRRMVLEATGTEVGLINLIEAPLDKHRNPIGWASVHFHSADLARRMVDRLNGVEFKGKTLEVRLMKEGEAINSGLVTVTAPGPSSSRQHRSSRHHHRNEDSQKPERKERGRGEKAGSTSASSASEGPAPSRSNKSAPLVVGGSLTAEPARSSSSSSLSHGKEKQGKGTTAVIIADGSSGRKGKKTNKH